MKVVVAGSIVAQVAEQKILVVEDGRKINFWQRIDDTRHCVEGGNMARECHLASISLDRFQMRQIG